MKIKKRIFIVEDEGIIASRLKTTLQNLGYEVCGVTATGESAIELVLKEYPDLVLMDINLAGELNGIETATQIHNSNDIPIIYLTAYSDDLLIESAKTTEPYNYLVKPVQDRELFVAIEMAVYRHEMEKQVVANEEKYRIISEIISDFAFSLSLDEKNKITLEWITNAFSESSGYLPNELVAFDRWTSIIYPEDLQKMEPAFLKLLQGNSIEAEFRLIKKNNELIWVNARIKPLWNRSRTRIIKFYGAAQDITLRKEAEHELLQLNNELELRVNERTSQLETAVDGLQREIKNRTLAEEKLDESQTKYRILFEKMTSGFALHEIILDSKGNPFDYMYLDVNPAYERITGQHKQKLIGNTVLQVMPQTERYWIEIYGKVALTGQETAFVNYSVELKKFFEILAFSPEYKKFAIIINDITEKKQTDQLIKESEERYRKLVEYSPEAIIIHNKGVIIYANPAAINGIGAQNSSQLEGKNILDFTHPGSLEAAKERIRQIYIENVDLPPVDEFNLVNFKGKVIRTEISSVALTFQGEKIVQIVIRDITDKKKIEQEIINSKEEAEEANRIKSSLLANMSHELRTPLNGILGFAQLLKDELFDSDQVNMAEKIIKSGRRLMNTLNSVLSLTELENNNYLISISEIDLPFFCAQMKLLYESAAGEKNLPVNLDLKVENLIVSTDENLLTKIIGSLMENAIKYTNKGSITIQLDRKISRNGKSVALINVIDTGIGIKQENRDIIFREFRQLSEGFRRDFEGLGLGLALVRKMVRLIGAKISLESALGIGSFFSVAIPADLTLDFTSSDQKESPEEKPGQFRKLVPSERIPDILLVEDNALNIEVVQRYLANSYKVSPANDGLTAIELARNNYFDILLIDINLGQGIDGIEVLKEIKKLKRYENVPVIALTGYASDKNKRDFLAQGFTHYLAKPFEKSELLNLLKQFLK